MSDLATDIGAAAAHLDRDRLMDKVRRLVEQYASMADLYTPEQVATFDTVIGRLLADAGTRVRMEMAEELARAPRAPPGVLRGLARDERVEVAEPILTGCAALDDAFLAEIVETLSQNHLLAVSRRKSVNPEIADALIARGNHAVIKALARNAGVAHSPASKIALERRVRQMHRENRRAPRKVVNYPAALIAEGEAERIACTLVDISKSGAKIALPRQQTLPRQVGLSFAGHAGGAARQCEVMWQNGAELGLRFL